MRITEVPFPGSPPVDSYGPGFFRVAGLVKRGPLALLPRGPLAWGGFDSLDPVLEQAEEFDVLLVGMGAEIRRLDDAVRDRLQGAGLGVEIMATPSACRTYNVLLAEGRRIGALLVPV